jgi:hypothetical protein
MSLTELKTFTRQNMAASQIKASGLDLRSRESWEALAQIACQNYLAAECDD